ncbi:penicillin-binding protein [Pelagirhabdus alkalitolerans]|uniref:serine-type D-Ala-D-Ala carboxypeptidase n=1 Tax=Pelagirhabdus alkalitolerans TaxID=1612202 RepID=A0A1G6L337_9BACI|nr:penicillin-binding transpeptidase domain-containing protein [Pelagirhabdus alkalitolerans]SDC37624.1 penicillin-binding protein [Pelagirhabdus alkalitolerans]
MKKAYLTWIILAIALTLLLTGCSEEDTIQPEDRLEEYVELWESQDYDAMYRYLSEETTENYDEEAFIERQENLTNDLSIDRISIEYTIPDPEEEAEEDDNEEDPTFPITVLKETVAGDVIFDAELTLIEVIDEEEQNDWTVHWEPSLIFPELEDDTTVRLRTLDTTRGEIHDRYGNGLAINGTAYDVGVDPGLFSDNQTEEIEEIASALSIDSSAIENALNQEWVDDGMFVPITTVSPSNEDLIDALSDLPAVLIQETSGRVYPYSDSHAHLIGHIGTITAEELEQDEEGFYSEQDIIGKRGLEQLFENRLRGEKGVEILAVHDNSTDEIISSEPVPGEDIQLTIDASLQESIFESLQEDDDKGTAAAIDPHTGETLALVSSPSFDPHLFTYGISQSEYDDLNEDEGAPLLNRFASTYSPGSAFKPITAMVGMQNGTITQEDAVDIDGLTWSQDGWGNYEVRRVSESTEPVDLHDALVRSDNIFFAQKTVEMGTDLFTDGLQSFGFDEDGLSYTYPIQNSQIANNDIDREPLLSDSGFGQGEVLMSALHLAISYTPILNEGDLLNPLLTADESEEVLQSDIITTDDADYLKTALRDVVAGERGTASVADRDGFSLSGKTGTAELKQSLTDEDAPENGWFVAYSDSEDHLIAMMIEDVHDKGGSGYTAEVLAEVFEWIEID